MSTTALTLEERFPRVSEQTARVYNLQIELTTIERKEQNLIASREGLIRQHPSQQTDSQLNELKVEIDATQDQKLLTMDRLKAAREDLPEVEAEAIKAEVDLTAKKEEIKTIRTKIEKIDGEITKALQKPISLIESRQEAVLQLGKTVDEIQKLTSTLRWHPPAPLITPLEPAAVTEFQELFPPSSLSDLILLF